MAADRTDRRAAADLVFDRALDLAPEAREEFVAHACGPDAELRAEVEELLRLASAPTAALEPGAVERLLGELAGEVQLDEEVRMPERVGAWRLVRELGRGGMGRVYLAERADGEFEQEAALKLLHPGVASDETLRRFERERQILAGLDHPGIARLLDGGRTTDGQPYLVMERVRGRPIDRHCDEETLGIEERLRLFVRVARAMDHAHRSLVVHRDLKPSNVLVTDDGEVKLLDFGVARLLDDDGPTVVLTGTAARVLTPEYASPEQVEGRPVTVASDVYQLGLLLYELLTGRQAHGLTGGSFLEMERTICRAEPSPPSAAAAAPAGGGRRGTVEADEPAAEELARRRGTTPRALSRRLRGDVDTIVLQALRKEPERRYPSVAAFVEDVERYLAGRPVHARGESVAYRASRFVRRHRLGVAGAALMLLLLVAYAATVTVQARAVARERDRAQAEAAKAEQVKGFVVRLFESADPARARGEEVTARELLDRGWAGVEEELSGQPEVQVELRDTVGEIYRKLGLYDRAGPLLESALAGARRLGERGAPLLARTLRNNGTLRRQLGDHDGAEALLREALDLERALLRARLRPDRGQIAATLAELGRTFKAGGDYAAAEESFREALALRREAFGGEDAEIAESLGELGTTLRNRGDYAAAEPLLREALELYRRRLPPDHPHLASALSDLALVLKDSGRYPEAEALYREAEGVMRKVWGEDHPHLAITLNNLARLLRARGELAAAEPLLVEALEIRRRAFGTPHPQVAMNLNDLGRLRYEAGDLRAAEGLYRDALAAYPQDHPWRSATIFNLGRVLEDHGDYRGAEELYREALARQREDYGERHERVGIDLVRIGIVRHLQGDLGGAEPPLREALEIFRERLPENHPRLAEALVPLGRLLIEQGRPDEAEPLLREALEILRAGSGAEDDRTREAALLLERARAAGRSRLRSSRLVGLRRSFTTS